MRPLPEVEFVTVREDAYSRAEELASFGFAVAVYNDGHIFRIETQEDFQPCNTSQPASFSWFYSSQEKYYGSSLYLQEGHEINSAPEIGSAWRQDF